jgi:hypothetical protein
VLVGMVAELDQRLACQLGHRLGMGLDPAAGHEDRRRDPFLLQDLEHRPIEAVVLPARGAGVEGDRDRRLLSLDVRDRAQERRVLAGSAERNGRDGGDRLGPGRWRRGRRGRRRQVRRAERVRRREQENQRKARSTRDDHVKSNNITIASSRSSE